MTRQEYDEMVAQTRAAPGWKPHGHRGCSDCETMSHCETHHKEDGTYPDDSVFNDPDFPFTREMVK